MKKKFSTLLSVVVMMSLLAVMFPPNQVAGANPVTATSVSTADQTTVTVTIVKIDLATHTITLKDQNGKIYVFTVDSTIDLSKFKVGQSATATISTTYTTNQVTRARISKMQLIKLQ